MPKPSPETEGAIYDSVIAEIGRPLRTEIPGTRDVLPCDDCIKNRLAPEWDQNEKGFASMGILKVCEGPQETLKMIAHEPLEDSPYKPNLTIRKTITCPAGIIPAKTREM